MNYTYCCVSLLHQNTHIYTICPKDVSGWFKSKNKQASSYSSERNGCGFGQGRRWRDGLERREDRGNKGGGSVEQESESCHKTTIIRSLSATQ